MAMNPARQPPSISRLGIVGSRLFADSSELTEARTRSVINYYIHYLKPEYIVSGGARGIDTFAMEEAAKIGYPPDKLVVYRPKPSGSTTVSSSYDYISALFARNTDIANDVDFLMAVMSEAPSSGTMDTVGKARRRGINVLIITVHPNLDISLDIDTPI